MIAPIQSASGYGERSRDIARSILKSDKYELKIWGVNWGGTPFTGLDKNNPEDVKILDCMLKTPDLPRQPDIHIHISVPSEFQPLGKFNIGITAGIETDHVDAEWLEGANRMQLLLVSSNHAKLGFTNTLYQRKDERGNVIPNVDLKLTTPIEVLFEGLDVSTFFKTDEANTDLNSELENITEDWAFLFVGHWLQGDLGQDRKDVGMLIKMFFETFKNKKKRPALIIKTSGASNSIFDKSRLLSKIDTIRKTCGAVDLPNVYLLHGELNRTELNCLYNHPKVKAHVTFTKGEGFGRPILEASVSSKPIIAPRNSGYLDFLEHAVWLPGRLTPIHPSAQWKGVLNAGTNWFTVDYNAAGLIMKDVYEDYAKYSDLGKRQAYRSNKEFTLDQMATKLLQILDDASAKLPKPVELKLPKLKKIELPKSETKPNVQDIKPIEHKKLQSPVPKTDTKVI